MTEHAVRRVVTGHDEHGRAVVKIDGLTPNVISRRPGHASCVVWSTQGFPVSSNDVDHDASFGTLETTLDSGTVFRVIRYDPGVTARRHRTDSIDYAVVLSGRIDMELDDGVVATLNAGDVLVQRGTIHSWSNPGPDPCVMAFVLVSADPVEIDGRALTAEG